MTNSAISEFDFDRETLAAQIEENEWQLELTPNWNINTNPNGGYLLACLLRSMASITPAHPDPVSVTTHYLRPGLSDKTATMSAKVVRLGRRTATVSGALIQEAKERIVTTATFGQLNSDIGSTDAAKKSYRQTITAPDLPPPAECTDRVNLGQGVDLALLSRVDVRIDPQYAEPGLAKSADIAGWIRFKDDRPADALSLAVFCDAFPPSIFSLHGAIGWVPTVELALHVRQRPQPGWVKAKFTTRDITEDLFIEDGLLWDSNNQLVAQSRQLQMILKR